MRPASRRPSRGSAATRATSASRSCDMCGDRRGGASGTGPCLSCDFLARPSAWPDAPLPPPPPPPGHGPATSIRRGFGRPPSSPSSREAAKAQAADNAHPRARRTRASDMGDDIVFVEAAGVGGGGSRRALGLHRSPTSPRAPPRCRRAACRAACERRFSRASTKRRGTPDHQRHPRRARTARSRPRGEAVVFHPCRNFLIRTPIRAARVDPHAQERARLWASPRGRSGQPVAFAPGDSWQIEHDLAAAEILQGHDLRTKQASAGGSASDQARRTRRAPPATRTPGEGPRARRRCARAGR